MSCAFKAEGNYEQTYFNKAINCWNTAHVTDMGSMFSNAQDFNQSLNDWDMANVTDMGDVAISI